MSGGGKNLERRVLAQDRVLQVLITHVAETGPESLARLKAALMKAATLVEGPDNLWIEHYAKQFARHVEILRENAVDAPSRGEHNVNT